MDLQLFCTDETRKARVRADATFNGIDYLEVLDDDAPAGVPRQQTLFVYCLKNVEALTRDNVRIEGGVRVTRIGVVWAFAASRLPPDEGTRLDPIVRRLAEPANVLVVRTDARGDFSTYKFRLIRSPTHPDEPPDRFDRVLSAVGFSFKVECDSDFDCRVVERCPEPALPAPQIDYLAKDYASFRRLLLDRLSVVMPGWPERNPADSGVAVVEVLAYAADRLSYYQDAVAAEAYLGTARRRTSVRRHARLLDYFVHDGTNARAWVALTVLPGGGADGLTLPGPSVSRLRDRQGTQFLTLTNAPRGGLNSSKVEAALTLGAEVFEAMHDCTLHAAHNEMRFYTWGDEECCLPRGATRARRPSSLVATSTKSPAAGTTGG